MPSNALSISQMIAHLQGELETHGDIDCVLVVPVDNAIVALDGRNINVAAEMAGQSVPQPVLVFGMWRDEAGRLRNTPGAKYETTGDNDGWFADRNTMPEGEDVTVWKRYGGQDIGKRVGDKFYVREGAAEWPQRPTEIIPAGILRWRP